MARKKKRGRPITFKHGIRRQLADLIREHGARRTSEISTVPVSVGTLLKIAQEFDVPLKKGRRPRKAA